jgi:hypothetical protein
VVKFIVCCCRSGIGIFVDTELGSGTGLIEIRFDLENVIRFGWTMRKLRQWRKNHFFAG